MDSKYTIQEYIESIAEAMRKPLDYMKQHQILKETNMGLMSIDTLCDSCQNKTDQLVDRELATNWDTLYICDVCGEKGVRRVWSIPNTTKESYPDGYKRGGDYQLLKESAKLQKKAASAKGETKKDLLKAASELRKASKAEKGKTR